MNLVSGNVIILEGSTGGRAGKQFRFLWGNGKQEAKQKFCSEERKLVIGLKHRYVLILCFFFSARVLLQREIGCSEPSFFVNEAPVFHQFLGWGWIRSRKNEKNSNFLLASDRIPALLSASLFSKLLLLSYYDDDFEEGYRERVRHSP